MKCLREKMYIFLLAVLAGVAIGIGGCVFLSLENKVAGALLFTVGLYTICVHGLSLYTGKIGYVVNQPPAYYSELIVTWMGNLAGTFLCATAMRSTRIAAISEKAAELCGKKIDDSVLSWFLLGVFCGFLMFAAVDGYKSTKNPVVLFVGVAVFILCGFEHCIADMFYFSIANMWSVKAFGCILIVTLGNSVGGILIPLIKKMHV